MQIKGVKGVEERFYSKQDFEKIEVPSVQGHMQDFESFLIWKQARIGWKKFPPLTEKECSDPEVTLLNIIKQQQFSKPNSLQKLCKKWLDCVKILIFEYFHKSTRR